MTDPSDYTADNIRVLTDAEILAAQPWARAATLAARYSVPVEWVARGLEACDRAGVADSYFVARYLESDRSIPLHAGVDEAFRDLLLEARDSARPRASREVHPGPP